MKEIERAGRRTARRRATGLACCLSAAALVSSAPPAVSEAIESFSVTPFFFSPARGDSATFRFTLADTASVFLFVFEDDSSTVVDTLVAGTSLPDGPTHTAVWHGRTFDGSPAPEGAFVALLRADAGDAANSLFSPLFFTDDTRPQVAITLVDPGLIAPGSSDPAQSPDVEITCAVSDPPPADSLEVDVVVFGPDGERVDALPERLVAANGAFKSAWFGEETGDDGLYALEVTVRDRALNSASSRAWVDVDTEGPEVAVTDPEGGAALRTLPDSLRGRAWDRHGVKDSLQVEYPGRTSFASVASTYVRFDTLFFAIVLRDSIAEEGRLAFRFRAVDGVGQVRFAGYEVTWDQSPPAAPVLFPLPAVTHSPVVVLDGTVQGTAADVMRIYRNDALADTLFPKLEGRWPHTLSVAPGLNRIRAVMVDEVGNASPPSNTLEVTFDPSTGVYIPQPFRPGDAFQLNFAEVPRTVTVRIFDLAGHVVRILEGRPETAYATIPWDGVNGDGEGARKGPFVAVVYAETAGGEAEVVRRAFVFEP